MEIPEGLELRESPIHGLGIFATRDFPNRHFFGAFKGIKYDWPDYIREFGRDYHHTYRNRRTNTIISARHERNFITYINDGRHNFQESRVNCVLKKGGCWAARDIKAGEELLLDYGRLYKWSASKIS